MRNSYHCWLKELNRLWSSCGLSLWLVFLSVSVMTWIAIQNGQCTSFGFCTYTCSIFWCQSFGEVFSNLMRWRQLENGIYTKDIINFLVEVFPSLSTPILPRPSWYDVRPNSPKSILVSTDVDSCVSYTALHSQCTHLPYSLLDIFIVTGNFCASAFKDRIHATDFSIIHDTH